MPWWGIALIVIFCVIVVIGWVHDMNKAMEPYELAREIQVRELRRRLKELEKDG